MNRVFLIPGLHGFLPVGTGNSIFEEHYQNYYKPYLKLLNEESGINTIIHHSGNVLEWIEKNHPEYFSLLKDLVKRKQVEMLGGGFFEPVLSIIPNNDKLGQIEKLTTYIRIHFGRRPRGNWMPEMVWEPTFVYTLKSSGMDYTILNDTQFIASGIDSNNSYYPVITEDQGKVIAVFPNASRLLYSAFSSEPELLIDKIRRIGRSISNPVIVLIFNDEFSRNKSDIEWMVRFLKLALKNNDWIDFTTPSAFLRGEYPLKKLYLPSASNINIDSTSKKNENGESFFRQFLSRYPDVNLIYSRMIHSHLLVNQIRGDKYKKRSAQNELWKAQCHSVYWHHHLRNRYGGVYNNSLRKVMYRAMLDAEKIARTGSGFISSIMVLDFDMDGCLEYLYQGRYLDVFVHTHGGMVIELDYLPVSWNYCDSIRRIEESYHTDEAKEAGYDKYPRKCFIDHFYREDITLELFSKGSHRELGDFTDKKYELSDLRRDRKNLQFFRTGKIEIDGRKRLLKLEKNYVFKRREIGVTYKLFNLSEAKMHFTFGVEFNLALPPNIASEVLIYHEKDEPTSSERHNYWNKLERENVSSLVMRDKLNGVEIGIVSNLSARLWMFPLETFSMKDGELRKDYQATTVVYNWNLKIDPMSKQILRLSMRFTDL